MSQSTKQNSAPYLSIIVPAYNEAERIPAALLDMNKRLQEMSATIPSFSYELIVVNDGSNDRTVSVVNGLADRIRNMRILDLVKNQGKGAAVQAGMLDAKGSIRIFSDADNSTSIDQFATMMPFFEKGFEVVIGSRTMAGAKLEPAEPLSRRVFGRGLNLIVQMLLLPGIKDTQCGFKAFTAEAAEQIFSIAKTKDWGFDVEVLKLAKNFNYRIKEIPVRWVNDERTHVTPSAGFKFLRDIVKIRWGLWTRNYPHGIGAVPKPDVIILAAGHGKRLRSETAKPLQIIGGKTALQRIIEVIRPLNNDPIIVIGNQSEIIQSILGRDYRYVLQKEQKGTGHAVICVRENLKITDMRENVIILPSDHPLITTYTLQRFFDSHFTKKATISLCTITVPNFIDEYASFADHGRIKRGTDGKILGIVEMRDATNQEKEIKEVNAGYYCFNTRWLFEKIVTLKDDNNQNEFYLTDMIAIAVRENAIINSYSVPDFHEGLGFNTPEQLANILKIG